VATDDQCERNRVKTTFGLITLLLAAGCAAPDTGPGRSQRALIVPRVDAHQHLMSAEARALVVPTAELAPVALPADLEALLAAREQVAGRSLAGSLFRDDAIVLEPDEGRWWQGRARVDRYLGRDGAGRRYRAKSFAVDGAAGYIAGTVRDAASGSDSASFVLGLTREGAAGPWRIASEMRTEIRPPVYGRELTADALVELLDDAGIRQAVVLSLGYWFGNPSRNPPLADEAARTRAENDWTVAQAARYPDRLVPFCGVNPLRDYALAEVERCASLARVRGMKIHLANSRVDLRNAEHVRQLREFFAAADRHELAIVVHARTQAGLSAELAAIFLAEVVVAAPNVPVQIAHMANSWPAASFFADAIAAGDPRSRRLYFDLTQAVPIAADEQTPEFMAEAAATLRRIGLERIFYGSDMGVATNPAPREWWKAIGKLPLSDDELRVIAANEPPYLR
jgi:predicted TIM-barrel fold metal-dependent hydrolase